MIEIIIAVFAILAIIAALMFLVHVLTRNSVAGKAADYTYREQAGELTPEELAQERREERENHERRTSSKEIIW